MSFITARLRRKKKAEEPSPPPRSGLEQFAEIMRGRDLVASRIEKIEEKALGRPVLDKEGEVKRDSKGRPIVEPAVASHEQMREATGASLGWNLGDRAPVILESYEAVSDIADLAALAEFDLRDCKEPWAKEAVDLLNMLVETKKTEFQARSFTEENTKVNAIGTHEVMMSIIASLDRRRMGIPTAPTLDQVTK